MSSLISRREVKVFIILIVIGIISILFGFITGQSICLFYDITGIPCPSCGMTRAFLALMKGNITKAFMYHPLFPLVIIIPFVLKGSRRKFIYAVIVIILFTWIIRLVLFFPHKIPMVYNNNALIPFIIRLIKGYLN